MILKKYSWSFMMSQFFQSICMKVPKFWLSDKKRLFKRGQDWGMYEIPSKIKTTGPTKRRWGFKWSQRSTRDAWGSPNFDSDKNSASISDRRVWDLSRNLNYWSQRKYSWIFLMSTVINFPKILFGGFQILIIGQK